MSTKYDSIIIGSGQGGNPLAFKLADAGRSVALIEPAYLGGTCINTGCTPTKTMVASAQIAHYARHADRWGVRTSDVSIDLAAVVKRKNRVVENSRSGQQKRVDERPNLHLYRGKARFVAPHRISVNDEALEGTQIFIDTGARPSIPALPGLDSVDYLTNVTLLEITEAPEHLLVLGGGYVGLEFGQIFRRFGSEVTIIQSGPQILPREDPDVAGALLKCLEAEGIKFLLDTKAAGVEKNRERIVVNLEAGDETSTVSGSHLLVATGRTPNTEDLDVKAAGIRTNAKGIYSGKQPTGNQCGECLGPGRRQRRPGIHTHFLQRFSDRLRESDGRKERKHGRPHCPLFRIHRPSIGESGINRSRCAKGRLPAEDREVPHDQCGPRHRA